MTHKEGSGVSTWTEVSCVIGEIGRFDTPEGRSQMTIEMTMGDVWP